MSWQKSHFDTISLCKLFKNKKIESVVFIQDAILRELIYVINIISLWIDESDMFEQRTVKSEKNQMLS